MAGFTSVSTVKGLIFLLLILIWSFPTFWLRMHFLFLTFNRNFLSPLNSCLDIFTFQVDWSKKWLYVRKKFENKKIFHASWLNPYCHILVEWTGNGACLRVHKLSHRVEMLVSLVSWIIKQLSIGNNKWCGSGSTKFDEFGSRTIKSPNGFQTI